MGTVTSTFVKGTEGTQNVHTFGSIMSAGDGGDSLIYGGHSFG